MLKQLRILLAGIVMLSVAAMLFAQSGATPRKTVNVFEQLAPWKAYYDSRTEWPRSHGYKPYKRMEWDVRQRGWPNGDVPIGAYWDALQQRGRMGRATLDENWINLGPFNHGGRARVLRFHPGQPDTMYAGSVSGSLWKSTDAGESWFPLTDGLSNIAVGCFEIDPSHPDTMYLGTGEGFPNIDAVKGIGLLKSTDGGATWNQTGISFLYSDGEAILKINIDPRNTQIVFASTNSGLKRSTDGGATFVQVRAGDVKELVRDPQNPDVLLCAAGNPYGSGNNGIYRSVNNGLNWVRSDEGLPIQDDIGRIVLAFYPGNSQIVYAGISGTFTFNGCQMLGIYRSVDNGVTWMQMSAEGINHYAAQGWYNMAIAVKPDESNVVFSAGLDINRSNNSGATWSQRSIWSRPQGDPQYVHADHHEIIYHPTHANELWEVTDGGIFKSTNNGLSWTEKNNGFVTFQYYAMGNATLDTALAYGGTQDNGTYRYHHSPNFANVFGGDGGYCLVDPTNDSCIYVEWQNGHRYRSDNGGLTFENINPGIEGDGAWVTPMLLDPHDHLTIYTTTTNGLVWRSLNQGRNGSWEVVGQPTGGDMQVLGASPLLPGRLYLGTYGSVYRYESSGNLWVNVSGNLPGAYVTRVVPDLFAPNTVYVTLSGFGNSHVWKSTQGGTVWQNISGNLPNVPFQDLVIDPTEPSTLYAGGDVGVFRTVDGGLNWHIFGEGLPAVRVDDMEMQTVTGVLRIATHGRGMWEIPTGNADLAMLYPNGGELLPPNEPISLRWSGISFGGNVSIQINRNYPSAAWETLFASTLNDGNENWMVAEPISDHVRWRISHLAEPGQTDTTDSDTRIVLPQIQLLYPNGGQTVLSGVRDTLRFSRTLVNETLRLEINRDYPSGEWEMLDEVNEDSVHLWLVRLPASGNARLRIVSEERPQYSDESDGDFILRAPQMTLMSPNGGEQIANNVPYMITWSAPEHLGNFRITFNRNYPSTIWEPIAVNTVNDGSYLWTPHTEVTEHCRVRLTTLADPQTYVESAADFSITAAAAEPIAVPVSFSIGEPHPNPFNPVTKVQLDLPTRTYIEARAFNRLGQEAAVLVDKYCNAGSHTLTFDGSSLPSGIYFIRIKAGNETRILKAALLK